MTRVRAGFTLLEMLIVIGVVGILLALGIPMLRPPAAYLFASDLKAMVQQARFEAIKRNRPVAVVWDSASKTYTTRFDAANTTFSNPSSACTSASPTILNTKRTSEYRNLNVSTNMSGNGIVWLPTGLPKPCGTGVLNSTTTVNDGRAKYNVVVSLGGRVKVEKSL